MCIYPVVSHLPIPPPMHLMKAVCDFRRCLPYCFFFDFCWQVPTSLVSVCCSNGPLSGPFWENIGSWCTSAGLGWKLSLRRFWGTAVCILFIYLVYCIFSLVLGSAPLSACHFYIIYTGFFLCPLIYLNPIIFLRCLWYHYTFFKNKQAFRFTQLFYAMYSHSDPHS